MEALRIMGFVILAFIVFVIYFIFKILQFVIQAINLYKKILNRQDSMLKILLDIRDNTKNYENTYSTSVEPNANSANKTEKTYSAPTKIQSASPKRKTPKEEKALSETINMMRQGVISLSDIDLIEIAEDIMQSHPSDLIVLAEEEIKVRGGLEYLKSKTNYDTLKTDDLYSSIEDEIEDTSDNEIFCENCKSKVPLDAKTCPKCGIQF